MCLGLVSSLWFLYVLNDLSSNCSLFVVVKQKSRKILINIIKELTEKIMEH